MFSHVTADGQSNAQPRPQGRRHVDMRMEKSSRALRALPEGTVWNGECFYFSFFEMFFSRLCGTIYQGLCGLCMYGRSKSRSPAQIFLKETPTMSKRNRLLSVRTRSKQTEALFSVAFEPNDPMRSRNKTTESLHSVAFEPNDPMRSRNKTTDSLHSVAFEPNDPMRSRNKTTESLHSVAIESTDPMWSQNKTTESLCPLGQQAKPWTIVPPIQNLEKSIENTATMLYQCVNLARVDGHLNMPENESVSHLESLLRSC